VRSNERRAEELQHANLAAAENAAVKAAVELAKVRAEAAAQLATLKAEEVAVKREAGSSTVSLKAQLETVKRESAAQLRRVEQAEAALGSAAALKRFRASPAPAVPGGSCTPRLPAVCEERNGLKVGDQVSLVPNGPQDGCIKGKQVGKIAEISFDEVHLQSPTHGRAMRMPTPCTAPAWYDLHACAPGRRRTFQRGGQRRQEVVV
jgi:multidrug efflux pump subunit AcrA (membrane-fusion protein)